jgi:cytochrome d ubiquinol oxidase subunit I
MRTSEAVTPMPGIIVPFVMFTLLYGLLALIVVWTIWRHIAATEQSGPPIGSARALPAATD